MADATYFVRVDLDDEYEMSLEEAARIAEERGLVIREPAANELFIDIDSEEDGDLCVQQLLLLKEHIGVERVVGTTSKSGLPHRHVVVTLARDLTALERIALQAALGSDRKHELLSFIALLKGTMEKPTLFFEAAR